MSICRGVVDVAANTAAKKPITVDQKSQAKGWFPPAGIGASATVNTTNTPASRRDPVLLETRTFVNPITLLGMSEAFVSSALRNATPVTTGPDFS